MNIHQASVQISFDKTSSDLLSVKLRVTYQRDRRRYALPRKEPLLLTPIDFEKMVNVGRENGRHSDKAKASYELIRPHFEKAEAIVKNLIPFSFAAFREAFYADEKILLDKTDVIAALLKKSEDMKQEGRIGNAGTYSATAKSLSRFVASFSDAERKEFLHIPLPSKSVTGGSGPITLRFANITPDFLQVYEQWMLRLGKAPQSKVGIEKPASLTTVGIYLRELRAIFNDAIADKLISQDIYPFGRKRYVVPAGANTKKALSKEDVLKIIDYQPEPGSIEQRGKDLWVFSYLSNGMNLTDICKFKWKDIDHERGTLTFTRQKTARTRKGNQVKITINLFPESLAILERWGTTDKNPDDFIFPFLENGMNPTRMKAVIRQVIKMTNRYVNRLAKQLGIQGEINTYVARHSFATILLRSEAPLAFISQSLGNANIKTTESYLGSFEDEQTKKYLKNLL